jgi:hypothetical protein
MCHPEAELKADRSSLEFPAAVRYLVISQAEVKPTQISFLG